MIVAESLPAPAGYAYTGIQFSLPDGTWSSRTPAPTPGYGLAVAVVGTRIYAIGGQMGGTTLNRVEEYDPVNDTWQSRTSMPTARELLAVAVVNNRIYAIGGGVGGSTVTYDTVEEYDPVTDTWTTKAPMPTGRYALQAVVVDNRIYAIGGYGQNPAVNNGAIGTVEVYDPLSDTWTAQASMPTPRHNFAVSVVDGKIYTIGGQGYAPFVPDVEVYDPAANTWSSRTAMPTARLGATASVINGGVYVIGGQAETQLTTVERYDPVSDEWTAVAAMPTERAQLSSVVLNNKIYAIGGLRYIQTPGGGPVFLGTVELFSPSTGYVLFKK